MCNFITEFGVIFIFAKIEGCGQKNIREIKILFDNSLIVSGVSLSEVKIGEICLARNQITFGKTQHKVYGWFLNNSI